MHGVIFTNFSDLVIEKWGMEFWNKLLDHVSPESGGIYVGTQQYEDSEMTGLVVGLSELTEIPVEDLLKVYGAYLYSKLASWAPTAVAPLKSFEDLLMNIDSIIHKEVRKLYPEAYVPLIESKKVEAGIQLIYTSKRRLTPVMEGLIEGAANNFNAKYSIECIGEDQPKQDSFTYLIRLQ